MLPLTNSIDEAPIVEGKKKEFKTLPMCRCFLVVYSEGAQMKHSSEKGAQSKGEWREGGVAVRCLCSAVFTFDIALIRMKLFGDRILLRDANIVN